MADPKWEETKELDSDIPKFEDTEDIIDEPVSKIESSVRGLVSGASLGFADELQAALSAIGEDVLGGYQEGQPKVTFDEEGRPVVPEGTGAGYEENLEETRAAYKKAQEDNPITYGASELAGGILPGLATGGGAAVGKVGAGLVKEGAEQAIKTAIVEGGKLGAKYGAVSGLGYSEGETPLEVAGDVAAGTAAGALGGALIPAAAKGAKTITKGSTDAVKSLLRKLPGAETIEAGYKYGRLGRALSQENLDEDLANTAKTILGNIQQKKKDNDLIGLKQQLDDLGFKVDTKEAINEAIDDLQKIESKDFLKLNNKEILPKLQEFSGINPSEEKLMERALRDSLKKKLQSQSAQEQAIIKGEKSLAKEALKSGEELQQINDIKKSMDDLGLPLDTTQGQIGGVKGKFRTPEGEERLKTVLSDTTEFQPEISKLVGPDGRPIVTTKDLGTGKVQALVGDVQKKLDVDLENMSLEDVDYLRNQLNEVVNLEKMKGSVKDPVIKRAMNLASRLKELSDQVVEGSGQTGLIDRRKTFSELFGAEELLGIKGRLAPTKEADEFAKITNLMEKLGVEGGIKKRMERSRALELLGEDVVPQKQRDLLETIRTLNARQGYGDENISRSGIYQRVVGTVPNIAGLAQSKASKIISPATRATEGIKRMSAQELGDFGNKLANSNNQGAKVLGNRLLEAMSQDGAAQNQILWSLSQSPAFRELVKRNANVGLEAEVAELEQMSPSFDETNPQEQVDVGTEVENSVLAPEVETSTIEEPSREPSSVANIDEALDFITSDVIEGGYQNQETDQGNFLNGKNLGTNHGITPQAYLNYYGVEPSEEDMRNLTKEQAKEIYKSDYLQKPKIDQIQDPNLQTAVMDFGINSGSDRAIKYLQNLVGVQADGVIGPKTLEAINNYQGDIVSDYLQTRRDFITEISKNPKYSMYEKGWNNRIDTLGEMLKSETPTLQEPVEEVEAPSEEQVQDLEDVIDRVNQQQSSGENTPMSQLDELLGKIDQLKISEADKDELEVEATNMVGYSDGQILKDKIRRLQGLS